MRELMTDLRLIETINKCLVEDRDPTLETRRLELSAIYCRIRDALLMNSPAIAPVPPEQELTTFLRANPQILANLAEEIVRETLAYVSGVCSYFESISSHRPLTEEEKAIGKQLKQLLSGAHELL